MVWLSGMYIYYSVLKDDYNVSSNTQSHRNHAIDSSFMSNKHTPRIEKNCVCYFSML